jgi:hypothetical protein
MMDAARWCQMTIIDAEQQAGLDAMWDWEGGRSA